MPPKRSASRSGRSKSPAPRGRSPARSPSARSKSPAPRRAASAKKSSTRPSSSPTAPASRTSARAAASPAANSSNKDSWAMSVAGTGLRDVGGPLFLMIVPSLAVFVLTYAIIHLDGSIERLCKMILQEGLLGVIIKTHPSASDMSKCIKPVLVFWIAQLLMMPLVPGKIHVGPIAPSGHRPQYKANGVATYFLTIILFFGGAYLGLYNAGIFADIAAPMYALLAYFSTVFCFVLYLKGLYAPSTADSGSTGTAIFDFFWGTELYPRFGHAIWPIGWDIKQFTNCRWGMMFWAIGTMSFAAKQYEVEGKIHDSMFISVLVQFFYVLKFFIWETGYFNTMDIQHDRAGFYICWGCLVWVPSLYTIHSLFLVNHPVNLGAYTAAILGGLGIMGVYVNWEADQQKIDFRESKGAKLIYGKTPVKIVASYTTEKGEKKSSLLLASGWWGVSRHFHYLPELLAAFAWSVPCLWTGNVLGFSYFVFLFFLLTDRSLRDEKRCMTKYGKYWEEYKRLVPYKVIPYVF